MREQYTIYRVKIGIVGGEVHIHTTKGHVAHRTHDPPGLGIDEQLQRRRLRQPHAKAQYTLFFTQHLHRGFGQHKRLWVIEHGPRSGDEINRVVASRNYGWPVISYGKEYRGPLQVGEKRALTPLIPAPFNSL